MSPPGRPKGEYRSAQREGTPVSAKGRPEREYRSAQREGNPGNRLFAAALGGVLFGLGLVVAGMTNPQKIVGFLDVFGVWDPSLALVMGGALAVTAVLFPLIVRRGRPLFDARLYLPTRRDLDVQLVAGSALFGVGWGIAGYCPGPALASLGRPVAAAALFVALMIAGMLGKRYLLDPLLARRDHTE
jgi:uncharacterized protein